jgi:regulator of replication initiation timing
LKDKDLYDRLQDLESAQEHQLNSLHELKESLENILEQNSELKIENQHLRAHLEELDADTQPAVASGDNPSGEKTLSKSRQNLEKLYNEGFHVCRYFYGSRREKNDACAFCLDVIFGEHGDHDHRK